MNAYQLAVTISLLPLASLGDIYGYRRVYRYGLVVFTIASLGCALSDSLFTLTIARVIQGFGAAGIMSVNGALVRFIYPRRWLGRGVGLNATIGSIASAVGPTVAAGILSIGPWPWLFAVNVPIGALAIAIAWRALPHTPSSGARFDAPSAIWSALTFGLLITAIDELGSWRKRQPGRRRVLLRDHLRLRPGDAAAVADLAHAAGGPAAHPAVRAVGRDLDLLVRRRRAWRWCRCRSCSRTRSAAARWRRGCC